MSSKLCMAESVNSRNCEGTVQLQIHVNAGGNMSIIFSEREKTFILHTKDTTYQMKVDDYGFLLHLYYGRRTEGCMDYLLNYADRVLGKSI